MIPRSIFRAPVDPSARLLLALLWTYARSGDESPFVWPSHGLLAEQLGCTERAVYRGIATLKLAGLVFDAVRTITWESRRKTTNRGWTLGPPPDDAVIDEATIEGESVTIEVRGRDEIVKDIPIGSETDLPTNSVDPRGAQTSLLPEADVTDHVLAHLKRACVELEGKATAGPRDVPANRDLIRRITRKLKLTPELWTIAIDRQLANVRTDPGRLGRYLSLATLCRENNMRRLTEAPSPGKGRPWSPDDWGDDEGS